MSFSLKGITVSGRTVNSATQYFTYATWDPTAVGTGITLSNGNLTATRTGNSSVRGTMPKSSGRWYYEILINTTGDIMVGIGNTSAQVDNFAGANTNSSGYRGNGTVTNPVVGSLASYTTGDYVGVGLDVTSGFIRYYKNGTLITSVALSSVTGSSWVPFLSLWTSGSSQVTGNFGASSFPFGVPSGFNAGWFE